MYQLPRNPQGGYFGEYVGGRKIWHKNGLVANGANWFLRDLFRKETALLPDDWYLGLTNAGYTFDGTTLASLAAGEPVGNGYARQHLVRSTGGDWVVSEVNGVMQVLSKIVTFACTGAPWTQAWQRAFLCDAAAGTVGNVICVSGPAPSPRNVAVGAGPSVDYTYFLRG